MAEVVPDNRTNEFCHLLTPHLLDHDSGGALLTTVIFSSRHGGDKDLLKNLLREWEHTSKERGGKCTQNFTSILSDAFHSQIDYHCLVFSRLLIILVISSFSNISDVFQLQTFSRVVINRHFEINDDWETRFLREKTTKTTRQGNPSKFDIWKICRFYSKDNG